MSKESEQESVKSVELELDNQTEVVEEVKEAEKIDENSTLLDAEVILNDAEINLELLQTQLLEAQQQAVENLDKAVRVQAEMENLKRRTQKDLENAHKYALEGFAKELLAVIDSLELGLQAVTGDSEAVQKFREGSELTLKQFETAFKKFNIQKIDPTGENFNPELHQAMTMQPAADVEANTVLNVFQKGYSLNGRLIRPAMVVVSKAV